MTQSTMSIGILAKRAGVAASALRFYEAQGLIKATRGANGRRMFTRDTLRRVAFVRVAQSVGLALEDIRAALSRLPNQRTPTRSDWQRLSAAWRPALDHRIGTLMKLRDRLTSCIGCGCLSLKSCGLYNPADSVQARGAGARYLLGDVPRRIGKAARTKRA
ncbi:MAG: redox-sensitive transcriptional activator SoxR [Steroidobacteraceae bacterium]|jgi:MerR family redox-sensitive transcriptional activator SoxR